MKERKGKQRGGRPRKSPPEKPEVFDFGSLRWDTAYYGKKSVIEICRAFDKGDLAEGKFKTLIYGARAIKEWGEEEREERVEAKLKELQAKVEEILGERLDV